MAKKKKKNETLPVIGISTQISTASKVLDPEIYEVLHRNVVELIEKRKEPCPSTDY
jgi:hypothetical protein